MEALLRCQVSHTVPEGQPQERCTNVLFQPRPAAHISDANGPALCEACPKTWKKTPKHNFFSFYFQMSWPTFLGVFLFPSPNSFTNLPGKTNVWKVTNENKDAGNCSSWIYSVYKVAGIAKKYSVFHRLKSFDMLKCVFGGGQAVRVYTIFRLLFALGSKRAEHTCAFWLSFLFFFFSPPLQNVFNDSYASVP